MPYVPASCGDKLRNYKYSGADLSFYYRYILTPMNVRLIELFPMWIAPNVITLTGLSFALIGCAFSTYYAPTFTEVMPSYVLLVLAACLGIYQTLDNLDGRQARRTGSSSPLGLLFDHGCDALNITVGVISTCAAFQMGTMKTFILWYTCMTLFFVATWEEYFTHELILPIVNGPSDGILISQINMIIAAVYPGIWAEPLRAYIPLPAFTPQYVVDHARMHDIVMTIALVGFPITAYLNIAAVRNIGVRFRDASPKLVGYIVLLANLSLWAYYSPSRIYDTHPRVFMFMGSFFFANIACKLMLAHITDRPYRAFRTPLIPLMIGVTNCILSQFVPDFRPLIDETLTLYALLVFSFIVWLHFVVNVIRDLCEILDIYAFTIKRKKHA